MATFQIKVNGVAIGLIETPDTFSKDPGPNVAPTAAPNSQGKSLNVAQVVGGAYIASIQNPG